jgi:serine/threonine protein kinase
LPDRIKSRQTETKKHSFTTRLKHRFLGKDKKASPVDTKFLSDLSDIKTVGRYQIVAKLGKGSMGMVLLGRDPYIKRNVAIKVSRHATDVVGQNIDRYREKFFVEAQSAGRLVHPNIVSIYDAGMYKDFCYVTMEYIDGYNLKRFCRKDYFLPVSKVVEIMFTACTALDYAHKQGVVHRDIKPSNIMIDKAGHLKITDFGIAQIKSEQTASKGIIGSINYMSPEHIREQPIEDKSDIFSLGCVLYELITGEKAFSGENDFAIMYKIVREDPVPIRRIRP